MNKKRFYVIGLVIGFVLILLSYLFRVWHWPGTAVLLILGLALTVPGFMMLITRKD